MSRLTWWLVFFLPMVYVAIIILSAASGHAEAGTLP
jgi:hypothetical protein